jgi:eukaryotic-like serine/threonine-protein kinase
MDRDVAQLVREQRLLEAARLASDRGDPRAASQIYEQACAWPSAAAEALRAGEAGRALRMAVLGGDEATARQALTLVVRADAADGARATGVNAAEQLARLGHPAWAARVLEGCGRGVEAARAWERAGEPRRAAALLESEGENAGAARVLEAALGREPEPWGIAVDLGGVLARLGRWSAAARVLQRVPAGAPQRRDALGLLAFCLDRVGLARAADDTRAELAATAAPSGQPADEPSAAPAAPAALTEPSPLLFERYAFVREIASSASARVLECRDELLGETVAVKIFAASLARGVSPGAIARFERDVRAVRALDHPCVVRVRAYVARGPAMVLAHMPGGTLEGMLARADDLAPGRAIEIACAVLSALIAAHRVGVLHRDVKPGNVLFDAVGGARLGDFGVAHLADASATATAGLAGARAYVSPEQREGRAATARSDVFSVGVMLCEMLTGERGRPYDPARVLPSEVHRGLDARHDHAVSRMTAANPDARPADASEAEALLRALRWPGVAGRVGGARPMLEETSSLPGDEHASRLESRSDGALVDRWLSRDVVVVRLTDWSRARARAFAQAEHPALQGVWRVDDDSGAIWLERLEGPALDRPLAVDERARLAEALDALHGAGGVHGQVDRLHVVVGPEGVVLRFDVRPDAAASAEQDTTQLAAM